MLTDTNITTLDFLRHGATTGGSYYRGSTDDPLNKLGWQQMSTAVANRNWDLIISSPLLRCPDFAQHLNRHANTPFCVEPVWQEIHFGDWEGKTADQIDPAELQRFYQDPLQHTPKHAKNFSVFLARINQAWADLIKQHSGKRILIITHAGVIRALFPILLNLPINKLFHLQVDHASLTRFQCFQDGTDPFIQLQFHNLSSLK